MDITAIIMAVVGLISGGGLTAIFTIKSSKRKAAIENESLAIEALKSTIQELRLDNARKDEIMAQYLAEREQYRLGVEEKAEENATCKNVMCMHLGCALRHPAIGRGDQWYKDHKEEPALGADYLPINQLLHEYGRMKKEKKSQFNEESKDAAE